MDALSNLRKTLVVYYFCASPNRSTKKRKNKIFTIKMTLLFNKVRCSWLSNVYAKHLLFDQSCKHEPPCLKFIFSKTFERICQIETTNSWSYIFLKFNFAIIGDAFHGAQFYSMEESIAPKHQNGTQYYVYY